MEIKALFSSLSCMVTYNKFIDCLQLRVYTLAGLKQPLHLCRTNVYLKQLDTIPIKFNFDVAVIRLIHFFNVLWNLLDVDKVVT